MIFPIWQPLFSSSHLLVESIGVELGEKATHTGTLDPLAEGVLVILTGEERLAKEHLQDWDKKYEFEILWGVATDSGDLLGKIRDERVMEDIGFLGELEKAVAGFLPDFSARRWQGKSAFEYAQEDQKIPEKLRRVKLFEAELMSLKNVRRDEVFALQQEKVASVTGEFRQEEILEDWRGKFAEGLGDSEVLYVSSIRVVSSGGFYVRQFIQDVAEKVGVPTLALSIVRTRNGPFGREDC